MSTKKAGKNPKSKASRHPKATTIPGASPSRPKTHSDVLWHFTGGPAWSTKLNQQNTSPKSTKAAYDIFLKILNSKELKIGGYHEVVKVLIPYRRRFDTDKKKIVIEKNALVEIKTSPVCCVADIPVSELFHHALRYGKVGIGFKRESIIKAGFNPVFYTLNDQQIGLRYYQAHSALEIAKYYDFESEISNLESDIQSQLDDVMGGEEVEIDVSSLSSEAESMKQYAGDALADLELVMSFIKTLRVEEFDTIYAEREWRSMKPFPFKWSDVKAVILPKKSRIYKDFSMDSKLVEMPSTVKVLTWEDDIGP